MKNRLLKYAKCLVIIIATGVVVQKVTYKIRDDKVKSIYDDSLYYDRVINAPTRSMQFTPITEDTLYLKRLEQEYKRLMK